MRGGQRFTIYFPFELLDELHAEGRRQSKTLSQLMRIAWNLSREQIRKYRVAEGISRPMKRRGEAA